MDRPKREHPEALPLVDEHEEALGAVVGRERSRHPIFSPLPDSDERAGFGWGDAGGADPPECTTEAHRARFVAAALLFGPRALDRHRRAYSSGCAAVTSGLGVAQGEESLEA